MAKTKLPSTEKVVELYLSGLSGPQIAQKYGVQTATVLVRLRREGVTRTAAEAAKLRSESGRDNPARYWKGKKQPRASVEARAKKLTGPGNGRWVDGRSRRGYRGVVEKVECSKCGTRDSLCIHHANFDHYDNDPENLVVLCVSCHMSLHKKEYWDAKREGRDPKKSTGNVGWTKR